MSRIERSNEKYSRSASNQPFKNFVVTDDTMWCEACGTVTNDRRCDCTDLYPEKQRLIPYVEVA